MRTKLLPTLMVGVFLGAGCGTSSDEPGVPMGGSGSGGSATAGSPTGGSSTSGSASGGSASGGTAAGGAGGTAGGGGAAAGAMSGGTAAGGSAGGGGGAGGSSGGAAGAGGNGGGVVRSKGCGKVDGKTTMTMGGMSVANALPTSTKLQIMSGGMSRDYIIDIPADYDPSKAYRLIFSWHQAYGSANGNANGQHPAGDGPNFDAKNYAYFGLHREATAANQPAIFVAPAGIGDFPWDFNRDSALFDSLLTRVNENLCVDESRVFTTGFSFGAMMSYSLSITRSAKLRGAVTMAPANYNLPGQPSPMDGAPPIAYFGITGMSDGTCPWVNNEAQKRGGKYCALAHAEENGCTIPANIQTAMAGSKAHVCYDFQGCKAGYPVKVCTFDGQHTPSSINDGSSNADDGLKAFVPPLAWKFISQL
ncbi:MAG: putative secreted protein [Polyangiaceae bacterium]|nr:putative secreted protein [Polyangiaceae bacterium]